MKVEKWVKDVEQLADISNVCVPNFGRFFWSFLKKSWKALSNPNKSAVVTYSTNFELYSKA